MIAHGAPEIATPPHSTLRIRTPGFRRVICAKCGGPTVTVGKSCGFRGRNGKGPLCSTCRPH